MTKLYMRPPAYGTTRYRSAMMMAAQCLLHHDPRPTIDVPSGPGGKLSEPRTLWQLDELWRLAKAFGEFIREDQ